MISFKVGSAVPCDKYQGKWNPHCHWIVQPGEPIEAEFVQSLLDKYSPHIETYAVSPAFGCYCIELQFRLVSDDVRRASGCLVMIVLVVAGRCGWHKSVHPH
jgi:hypothetical protein